MVERFDGPSNPEQGCDGGPDEVRSIEGASRREIKEVVELGGIEPPTSCMPCKRSTN